jgi:lipid A ethanolaminephosphotransferase
MTKPPFWTSAKLAILFSVFVTFVGNVTMYEKLFAWQSESGSEFFYVVTLIPFQVLLLTWIVSFLTFHGAYKYVLSLLLLVTAVSSYFSDAYGVVIDRGMLINAMETNTAEARDLMSWQLLLYVVGIFILPTIWLFRLEVRGQTFLKRVGSHFTTGVSALVIAILVVLSMSSFYASFFREQKAIRAYSNPLASLYASYQILRKDIFTPAPKELKKLGQDAKITQGDVDRELVVMVVGETARADHFSLNGYARKTNPLLEKQAVVSFTDVDSCGTSTAHSVPCMFSIKTRQQFSTSEAKYEENALDVLNRAGVNVIWRDNNSSSKGVADRVEYQDFRSSKANPICDPECRDVGMLSGLDKYIQDHPKGDILIVLHQMGSHGPTYYQRYPKEFAIFGEGCETNQLDQCSTDQITSSYDSTILYTDYFLNETIEFLKQYDQTFETSMLYVSDHGESLGENGLYLHAMPYAIAPRSQTNVPVILWMGAQHADYDLQRVLRAKDNNYSHDYVFHTLLGLFEIESKVYQSPLDLINLGIKKH